MDGFGGHDMALKCMWRSLESLLVSSLFVDLDEDVSCYV